MSLAVILIVISVSPADSIFETKPDYIVNGVSGFIGGIAGFGMITYATTAVLARTHIGGANFPLEMGYVVGYTFGIPLGASSFIHFNPFNKQRSKNSFVSALKNSLIGTQLGLCGILIAAHISPDTKYWAGLFVLPFPIIGAIKGYHSAPLNLRNEKLDDKNSLIKIDNLKVSLRVLEFELK